jgi:hypothetical protein
MPWEVLCIDPVDWLHDPVTTEPFEGEAPVTVTAGRYGWLVANLQLMPDAGSDEETHIPSYISGYFDGEGCFSVAFSPRAKLRAGWEVRPSVSVSQNGDRSEVLWEIQRYFDCGTIRPDRSDQTLKWEVRNCALLRSRILPHFKRYPLRSSKQRDVELLTDICDRMSVGDHLVPAPLIEIVNLAALMNPSGIRRYAPAVIISELQNQMKA